MGEPLVTLGLTRFLRKAGRGWKGKRLGLITNHSGRDETGRSNREKLRENGFVVARLLAPEHGLEGTIDDAVPFESYQEGDAFRVVSLYGKNLRPAPEDLAGLDALLYDIQDVGCRFYTFITTLLYCLEEAARSKLPVIVLDRPNPLGGAVVEGPVLEDAFRSFVGPARLPTRYGMTAGELARWYVVQHRLEMELTVIPLEGWSRGMLFPDTGLPWIAPSPNLPDFSAVQYYPATCLFEGTGLSEGRGTPWPFAWTGAPWLEAEKVFQSLPEECRGKVDLCSATPVKSKFAGEFCQGFRFTGLGPDGESPLAVVLEIILAARKLHPDRFTFDAAHFDRLLGTVQVRRMLERGDNPSCLVAVWDKEGRDFVARSRNCWLY